MNGPERIVLRVDRMVIPAGWGDDAASVEGWLRCCAERLQASLSRVAGEPSTAQVERCLRESFGDKWGARP